MPSSRIPPCLAILLLLLTGCAGTTSSACPPVPAYTDAEQDQAASELQALPSSDVMLPRMMGDYGVMRAQARRCIQ